MKRLADREALPPTNSITSHLPSVGSRSQRAAVDKCRKGCHIDVSDGGDPPEAQHKQNAFSVAH